MFVVHDYRCAFPARAKVALRNRTLAATVMTFHWRILVGRSRDRYCAKGDRCDYKGDVAPTYVEVVQPLSSAKIWSMTGMNGPSFGFTGGFLRG